MCSGLLCKPNIISAVCYKLHYQYLHYSGYVHSQVSKGLHLLRLLLADFVIYHYTTVLNCPLFSFLTFFSLSSQASMLFFSLSFLITRPMNCYFFTILIKNFFFFSNFLKHSSFSSRSLKIFLKIIYFTRIWSILQGQCCHPQFCHVLTGYL